MLANIAATVVATLKTLAAITIKKTDCFLNNCGPKVLPKIAPTLTTKPMRSSLSQKIFAHLLLVVQVACHLSYDEGLH